MTKKALLPLLRAGTLPTFPKVVLPSSLPNAAVSKAIQLDAAGNIYRAGSLAPLSISSRAAGLTDPADNAQLNRVAPGQLNALFGAERRRRLPTLRREAWRNRRVRSGISTASRRRSVIGRPSTLTCKFLRDRRNGCRNAGGEPADSEPLCRRRGHQE
jgi:hypothetical protein